MNASTLQRFWEKVEKTSSCWLWKASKRNKGYGAFVWADADGRVIQGRAHRFAYELHKGKIPQGMCVLHKCDTPACVNPEHLFLGTRADNNVDMLNKKRHVSGGAKCGDKGKWKRGASHHGAKLTPEDVAEIRSKHALGNISYGALGKQFKINGSAVFKIVKRLLWKHIA